MISRSKRSQTWHRALILLLVLAGASWADWPHWRGIHQDGVSDETGLPGTWSKDGENLLWDAPAGCRSAPLVLDNHVYLLTGVGDVETRQARVVALDLDTGRLLWEHRFNVFMTDVVFHRLGWANLAADPTTGYIYAHGVGGMFFCFDRNGKVVWKHSLTEELGRISGYGGRTYGPIIEGNQVILPSLTSGWGPHAKGAHRFFGMDKRSGEILWINEAGEKPKNTAYSEPVTTTLDGARIMFTGLADGSIAALRPLTGETVWRTPLSEEAVMSTVIYDNGRVYATHGRGNLDNNVTGRVVCLDARTGREIWRIDGIAAQYTTPALHDGLLYVADNAATLHCVDVNTHQELWAYNYGNVGKGSPVYADGKIYIGDVPGGWRILQVNRQGARLLSEQHFTLEDGAPDAVFATPAVSDGRVILSTLHHTYCISTKPASYRSPKQDVVFGPTEAIPAGRIARIQVEPAETVMAPGQRVRFMVKGFDKNGTPTRFVTAAFTLAGLQGRIGADGTFTAAGNRIQAGTVKAVSGAFKAAARVRVVPALPYTENFDQIPVGQSPPGWIMAPIKAQVSEVNGQKVLRKMANRPEPPFARLRGYIMPPIETGYTIQSDILGFAKKNRFLPDMGLINSRYLMILTGTSERTRKLRLVSWTPLPRIIREVEYPWKGDTWYSARFSVDMKDGKGLIRAKVWPRGEREPGVWTLNMEDPCPNPAGSPGVYAYSVGITGKSKGTEVLFDNVTITRNQD